MPLAQQSRGARQHADIWSGQSKRPDLVGRRYGVVLVRNAPVALNLAQAYGQPKQETVLVRRIAWGVGTAAHDRHREGNVLARSHGELLDGTPRTYRDLKAFRRPNGRATIGGRARYSFAAAIGWLIGATATVVATWRRSTGRWRSSGARAYFDGLKSGRLKVLREIEWQDYGLA
jgi:hypothetical protein